MKASTLGKVAAVIAVAASGLVIPAIAGIGGVAQATAACVEVGPGSSTGLGVAGVAMVSAAECSDPDPAAAAITVCANPGSSGVAEMPHDGANLGAAGVDLWVNAALDHQGAEVRAAGQRVQAYDENFPAPGVQNLVTNLLGLTTDAPGPQGTVDADGVGISSETAGC